MHAAMLGSFLEFSICVESVAAEAQFYRSLGFADLPAADFVAAPYAALSDGAAVIGLHGGNAGPQPALTFVRQDLGLHLRSLRRRGMEIEDSSLGEDEFHRASARDPAGQVIQLLEARTFSPAPRDPSGVSACGEFVEYSLPTRSIAAAIAFWTGVGLEVVAESADPHPAVRLAGLGLVVGFHEARLGPGMSFLAPDFDARSQYLRARGCELRRGAPPALTAGRAATLTTPSGFSVYLHEPDRTVEAPEP